MWGGKKARLGSGGSSSSYNSSSYSSSSYGGSEKDIYDYRDDVKYACSNNYYCSSAPLNGVDAYVSGSTIVVTFKIRVFSDAQAWEIEQAMDRAVNSAANETGCPYDISYRAEF